ncbi:DUF7127 family protein [Halostella litorea]|uniref:DUF7127 family protein n=1 Tax=Halostella litorea TaxID=2528831 RepID=UPI001092DAAE|nr:hypothetical protein [Halostella litorea]
MKTPSELESVAGEREAVTIAEREYDGESVVAVDFGPAAGEPSVDVVGGTAIVVVDDAQYEFDVPPDADEVTTNGGVLTIRAER